MVSSKLARVAAPAAILAAAAAVSMALAGRPAAHAQPRDGRQAPRGLTTERIAPEEAARRIAEAGPPPAMLRSMTFGRMAATVVGRQVVVEGAADVSESVAGNAYYWLLRVYEAGGKKALLDERHYTDGALVAEQPGHLHHQFADAIELAPGKYKIELTIYAAPQGFAAGKLPFGADMRQATLGKLSRPQVIEVVN
jgi:hypothetical protein